MQKKPCPGLLGAAVEKPHLCKKSAEEDDEGSPPVTLAAGCRGAALTARRVRGATAMTPLIRQKLQTSGYWY